MQNRIKMLEKDLKSQLNEVEKLVLLKNQMTKAIAEQDSKINIINEVIKSDIAEILELKPKAEKWDAELQRQRDKQKRRREKVKLQSGIEKFVTKNLGLKTEVLGCVGRICDYNRNENMIIVGFENNYDSNPKWTEGAIRADDTLLINHNFYMITPLDINTKIIK
jgi:outer membrane cobalamin receptor